MSKRRVLFVLLLLMGMILCLNVASGATSNEDGFFVYDEEVLGIIGKPYTDENSVKRFYGDVDNDGFITMDDVALVKEMVLNRIPSDKMADVDLDGQVTLLDVARIIRFIRSAIYIENSSYVTYKDRILPNVFVKTYCRIEGNVNISGQLKVLNSGQLRVEQNATLNVLEDFSVDGNSGIRLYMFAQSKLCVYGDTLFGKNASSSISGFSVFECKGDFTLSQTSDVKLSKLVYSGNDEQIVNLDDSLKLTFEDVEFINDKVQFASKFPAWTLQRDTVINNVEFDTRYLQLNGYTLQINGDLTVDDETIYFDGGVLIVKGDYTEADGYVDIAGGTLSIDGDFIAGDNYNSLGYSRVMDVYGRIEVAGDVRWSNGYFLSEVILLDSYEHKVEIVGHNGQYLKFETDNLQGMKLMFTDSSIGYNQEWLINGYVELKNLDTTLKTKLQGNSLVVNSGFTLNSDMNFGGGALLVDGDLNINAPFNLEGGKAYILGNCTINQNGVLYMDYDADYLYVRKNFTVNTTKYSTLKAGHMQIGGNFTGDSTRFKNQGTNMIEVESLGDVTVTGVDNIKNLSVYSRQWDGRRTATMSGTWTLNQDTMVWGDVVLNGSINLNGYNLKVFGNLTANTIYNSGSLSVTRNVTCKQYWSSTCEAVIGGNLHINQTATADLKKELMGLVDKNKLIVDGVITLGTTSNPVAITDIPSYDKLSIVEDMYPMGDYDSQFDNAIQVYTNGNNVNIVAYIKFTGDALKKFPGTDETFAEVAIEGIRKAWGVHFGGTEYDFPINGYDYSKNLPFVGKVEVTIIAITDTTNWKNLLTGQNTFIYYDGFEPNTALLFYDQVMDPNQKFLEINIDMDNFNPITLIAGNILDYAPWSQISHHRTWGAWSKENVGTITLYRGYNGEDYYNDPNFKKIFMTTAAHEFGHALGLSDAYYDEKDGRGVLIGNEETSDLYIMFSKYFGAMANSNDIEMVLEAFATNTKQYYMDCNAGNKSVVIRCPQEFVK